MPTSRGESGVRAYGGRRGEPRDGDDDLHGPGDVADSSDTFMVRLDGTTVETKSGQISFTTNDSGENRFNYAPGSNAPPLKAAGGLPSYAENQVATAIDTVLTASDADSANLAGATMPITANFAAGQDVLANFWVSEGPGPGINGQEDVKPNNQIGGAIQAIAVNPTDPNIMYVGSVNGGIWKTTNATAAAPHWVPLIDNLPSLSIGALEFDPTDGTHQTLIAGIGATSSNRVHDTAFTGVLLTTDGGATWSQLGTTTANLGGESITSVAARGTTLLAAADNGWAVQNPGLGKGLFRSTDSGVTWTLISDGAHGLPNSQSVSDLVGDPLNSNVLYAGVTGTGGGVFKSIDTGLTWTNISSGIGITGSTTDKIELAVHHDATTLDVFATVDNGGVLSGIFRSANGGSFVALDVPSGGAFGDIFGAIAADPTNPNIAYVGYGGGSPHYLTRIDASKPSGSQITDISGGSFGSPHVDVREMQIDANGNLILGTDGGLFRLPTPTGNAGVWSAIVGDISVFEVHSIAYDDISHSIMVGTQDNGTLFQQTPGGATWDHAAGGDGGDVVIDDVSLAALGESIRYFSSQNLLGWTRQVYDSGNHVVSTTFLSPAPAEDDEDDTTAAPIPDSQFTTPVELNIVDPTRLLVGGSQHIYESKDQGTTLTAIANGGVNGIGFNGGGVMVYGGFQNGVADPDLIYAASGASVLRQTASGGGFTTTSPGASTIRGVTDNPTNWAAVFTIDDNQVFESTNAGATWVDVTANLTSISAADFRSIEYVHGALDDALVVGTSSGVFYAHVSGLGGAASWSKFGSNLPDVIVYDLEYDATDNVLVAGTMGRGAWQVNNATTNLGIGGQAPVLDAAGGSLSYTENQAATAIDTVLTASDADSADLTGATVTITANFAADQDVLGFTNQNGITGSYNSATGVLTLSGASSVANYQAALRSVTYFNSSDNPSTATRTISYQVDDGAAANDASNVVTATVEVTAVNDAPVLDAAGGSLSYTENQAATAIDTVLTASDADSADLTGATVTITANFAADQDVLGFTNQNGITGSYNSATGVLTLSGASSVANYQAALRSVTYFNSSDNPSTATRTISYQVDDGAVANDASNVVTASVEVTGASMAITATFLPGASILSIFGDAAANAITVSRNAAGTILVNGGAVPVLGGTPTVANTARIQAFGLNDDDTITLNESFGALPAANLFGGAGNDTLTGGSAGDMLFGQSGNDTLLGKGGNDLLFGGADDDVLVGGDGDDQMFGESGNDRMIWNPGDDSDLMEGGAGIDTAEVNGGNGAETFTVTANGTRVRFDRVSPAPFSLDIGTTEKLVVNMNGGNDSFSATGNLAALISITVDGGAGNDTILGSNGNDTLLGGTGNDFIDGQQGNDLALLGAGNDVFQWDPGDGSDTVEGQAGADTLLFNGSAANEIFELSANGGRALFTRNVGNIVMDINDVETVALNTLGGTDTLTVNDLSGTDVTRVNVNVAGTLGGNTGDGQPDTVIVNATNGNDSINVVGAGTSVSVLGLPAQVAITNAEGANDTLVINGLGGDDTITATTLPAGVIKLTIDAGAGNDTVLGSQGADTILGGDGDDFVLGDNGDDFALLGAGDDVFQWNPGDGNDTIEGQDGSDTMRFFGANIAENINIAPNGGRVLFTRNIANVTMDLNDVETIDFRALGGADNIVVGDLTGTDVTRIDLDLRGPNGGGDGAADTITVNATQGADVFGVSGDAGGVSVFGLQAAVNILFPEAANDRLVLNGQGVDDVINASGLQAGAIQLTMNGGLGADLFLGSEGNDLIVGGDGDDVALMGAGDDTFVWNPGDDNDVVEGQAGTDKLLFNGANISENIDISANGGRVLFFRNIASVTMDLNDTEVIDFNALGGADTIVVNDLSGTDVSAININLAAAGGAGDGAADTIIINATQGDDVVVVNGNGGGVTVLGLASVVNITGFEAANDRIIINGLAGDDVIEASGLAAGTIQLTEDGGDGNDILVGSAGNDTLLGGPGDDVLIGNGGVDVLDGGPGDNVVINSATFAQTTLLSQFIASSFVPTGENQSATALIDPLLTQQQPTLTQPHA